MTYVGSACHISMLCTGASQHVGMSAPVTSLDLVHEPGSLEGELLWYLSYGMSSMSTPREWTPVMMPLKTLILHLVTNMQCVNCQSE